MKIEAFSQTGSHQILLMLLAQGELKITDISTEVTGQTAYRALNVLQELNLVQMRKGSYNTKFYSLTDKGKRVAEHLNSVETILQED